jgi:hypothetical protein
MLYWFSSAILTSSKLLYCCRHSKHHVTWVIHILRRSVIFYFYHLQIREQICKHKFLRCFLNVNCLVISAVGDGAGVLNSWISTSKSCLKSLSVAEIFMIERHDLAELVGLTSSNHHHSQHNLSICKTKSNETNSSNIFMQFFLSVKNGTRYSYLDKL